MKELKNSPKVLIIVPAFNEEETIKNTINKLLNIKLRHPNYDICIINDGSRDSTVSIIKQHNVILLDLPCNLGIGGAVQTGYKYAYNNDYDIAVQFDADGQHNDEDLELIINPIIHNECDMCIGSRFIEKTDYKGSLMRRVGIYYFTMLLYSLTKKKYTDPTSGFRAINKQIINLFAKDYPRDYPEPEVLLKLYQKKFNVKEVSVNMKQRQGGQSSITPFKSLYYMGKVTLSILMQKLVKE